MAMIEFRTVKRKENGADERRDYIKTKYSVEENKTSNVGQKIEKDDRHSQGGKHIEPGRPQK
jgi:hypothetical protein